MFFKLSSYGDIKIWQEILLEGSLYLLLCARHRIAMSWNLTKMWPMALASSVWMKVCHIFPCQCAAIVLFFWGCPILFIFYHLCIYIYFFFSLRLCYPISFLFYKKHLLFVFFSWLWDSALKCWKRKNNDVRVCLIKCENVLINMRNLYKNK